MKRFSFCILLTIFLLIGLSAKADTTTSSTIESDQLGDAGLVPGDFFYFLDRFFENVSLQLTFNNEKKVEKLSDYAEERLAELNKISTKKNQKNIDELMDDYGVTLNEANNLLNKMIIDGDTDEATIEKLQTKISDVTSKEELVKSKTLNLVNQELKNKVDEVKVQSYLTTMSGKMNAQDNQELKSQNIRSKDRVKIKAISELSGLTVNEVLKMDIYMPDDPTTSVIEKEIDSNKLQVVLGLTQEELLNSLKEYNEALKENRQAEQEKENVENNNGKSQEEKDRIKQEAEEKQQEAENKKNQIKDNINKNLNDHNGNGDDDNDNTNTHGQGQGHKEG